MNKIPAANMVADYICHTNIKKMMRGKQRNLRR